MLQEKVTKSNTSSNQKTTTKILKNIIENCNAHGSVGRIICVCVSKNKVVLFCFLNWITTEKTSEKFVLSPFVSFLFSPLAPP